MNNLEIECFNFVEEILCNFPKNQKGEVVLYQKKDIDKITEIINGQKDIVEFNKNKLSKDCYKILIQIYDGILKIVTKSKV